MLSYQSTKIKGMVWLRILGKVLLYLLIILLGCIWTVLCFSVIMTTACLGCCMRDCRDDGVALIVDGVNTSVDWSLRGWRGLFSLIKELEDVEADEEMGRSEPINTETLTAPPPAFLPPSKN